MTEQEIKDYLISQYKQAQTDLMESTTAETTCRYYTERQTIGRILIDTKMLSNDELQEIIDNINNKYD